MTSLSVAEVRRLRLISLLLAGHDFTTPEQVVEWFSAMQAQDLASVKWSLGVRLPGLTETDIDEAIERGSILRTWPMRGTIHLIPARDARWMLATMGVRQLSGVQKRWDYLGLDRPTVERAGELLAEALTGNKRLTRSQAAALFTAEGIDASGQRLYHLLWHSSQVGITCIGPTVDKEQTFVLLSDWAPDQRQLEGEEALAELAWSYFRAHGPALVTDFSGWAGIPVTAARKAVEANVGRLTTVETEFGDMWLASERDNAAEDLRGSRARSNVLTLPGFDELILGYKDRRAFLEPDQFAAVVPGNNGVFKPTVVDAGRVVGIWKRTVTKSKVKVEAIPFAEFSATQRKGIGRAAAGFGQYLGLPAEVVDAKSPSQM